jgi:ABC-type transporter MlaC component
VNLRLIVTILVIAAAPVWALAQNSTPAKVTKTDAQKVLKIISGDSHAALTPCCTTQQAQG